MRVRKRVRKPFHVEWWNTLFVWKSDRDVFVSELKMMELCGAEAFQSWGCGTKSIAIFGSNRWPDQARVAVHRIGKKESKPTPLDRK